MILDDLPVHPAVPELLGMIGRHGGFHLAGGSMSLYCILEDEDQGEANDQNGG
jgi:hypothetical protein